MTINIDQRMMLYLRYNVYKTFEPLDVNFKRSFQCLTRKSYMNIYSYFTCTFKTFFQMQITVVEYFISVKYVVEILRYGFI